MKTDRIGELGLAPCGSGPGVVGGICSSVRACHQPIMHDLKRPADGAVVRLLARQTVPPLSVASDSACVLCRYGARFLNLRACSSQCCF